MQSFINGSCPAEVVANLNFETLTLQPTSMLSSELKEIFSDLVYTCDYKNKVTINITLLFEHKSERADFPHQQLLNYIVGILNKSIKENNKPIITIPIIFYHGLEEWNYRPIYDFFEGVDEYLKKYIPSFEYILINVQTLSDEQIETLYQQKTLQMAMFLMKYIFDTEQLIQKTAIIFANINQIIEDKRGMDVFETVINYISNALKQNEMEILKEKILDIYPKTENVFESYADYIERRGIEKGIERGFEKGIEKGIKEGIETQNKILVRNCYFKGFSLEEISQITNLPIKKIKEIIKILKKEKLI